METNKRSGAPSLQNGFSTILLLLIILLIFLGGLIGLDFGYIAYMENQNIHPTPTPLADQVQTPVVAQGSFSKDKYSANITLYFNLEGGAVSGEFSGDCEGKITGNYEGGDQGTITGQAFGSCSPFFVPVPASANFSGTVNHGQKSVPITGTGSAMGFSGNGSLVLRF